MNHFSRGPRVLTVKVTNTETGRQDVHRNISKEEADWIALTPSLKVEVLEVSLKGRHGRKNDKHSSS